MGADQLTPGTWQPPGGLPSHPFGGRWVEGVQAWGEGQFRRWYVEAFSPAWEEWIGGRQTKAPVVGAGRDAANLFRGPWRSTPEISVEPGGVETGEGDPVTQYANDPALGPVPVGTPTNQGPAARVFWAPTRFLARLLPPGEMSPAVAVPLRLGAVAFWGALAWWLFILWQRKGRA